MDELNKEELNEQFRRRTKLFAVAVVKFCKELSNNYIDKVIINQLVKSATSTAANYRAACRARSKAEFFSKISIVVEEADETLFWLELIEEAGINNSTILKELQQESLEILKIVAKARKNIQ